LDLSLASVLPIPLSPTKSGSASPEAKAALGYGANIVLLLTIASPFKYSASGQTGFLELVEPVLARHRNAVILAVGPEPTHHWQAVSRRNDGRVVALGTRWENEALYAAADIYLDSVPFSSITSLLEAGMRGLPLLSYRSSNEELSLLGPGAPGLERAMLLAEDQTSYRNMLSRLILDAEYRQACGRRIQTDIISLHTGKNWIDAVQELYATVATAESRGCLVDEGDVFEMDALTIALNLLYRPSTMRKAIVHHLAALPYRTRASLTLSVHGLGFELSYLNLLPSAASKVIRYAGRRIRRAIEHTRSRLRNFVRTIRQNYVSD
jgi:hypothetical protein